MSCVTWYGMDKQHVNGALDIGSTLLEPGSCLDQCSGLGGAAADGADAGAAAGSVGVGLYVFRLDGLFVVWV